jgi:3-hydroxymyristoyl/3-hydroxydecanoyl-(acyl carrier protein) dehydratase
MLDPASRSSFAVPLPAVDDIVVTGDEGVLSVLATKTVTAADPYLQGHFPEVTVYPGVFVLETAWQAVCAALADTEPPRITRIRSLRFLAPLGDGDRLTMQLTIKSISDGQWLATADCTRGEDTKIAVLKVEFARGDRRG